MVDVRVCSSYEFATRSLQQRKPTDIPNEEQVSSKNTQQGEKTLPSYESSSTELILLINNRTNFL